MKILVMGSGVIGVTSAWYLAREGHQVTVVDRHAVAGNETSFANAGLVAPGHSYPWASPRAPKILWRSLFREGQALRWRLRADPRMWAWGLRFLRNCTAERARVNTTRKLRLCLYSQAALHELVAETGVTYDGRTGGLVYLYRDAASLAAGVANMRVLQDDGMTLEALDRAGCVRVEPALGPVQARIAGGIYAPTDESGDSNLFTRRLAEVCGRMGVGFHFETTIERIQARGGEVTGIRTSRGELTADAYVLAAGCQSPILARPLGIRLPIYPVKGYSVTLPIGPGHVPPSIGGVDENNLFAFCRMGDRLRLTATAEFAGYDTRHGPADFRTMLAAARDLFPRGGDYDRPSYWAGLRPMTPEGTPIIGRTRYRNLWLNTGHGHMGWTMACGSGRILADLVQDRPAAIDLTGIAPASSIREEIPRSRAH